MSDMDHIQAPDEAAIEDDATSDDEATFPSAVFALSVTLNAMSVLLHLADAPAGPSGPADVSGLADLVVRNLIAIKVAAPPGRDELESIIAPVLAGSDPGRSITILEGTPAVRPVDGRIEWEEDFFATGYAINSETGQMDYWQKLGDLAVHEGQLLARVFPPRAGSAGKTVFGKTVPVGKAVEATIRAGDGTECLEQEDMSVYVATAAGRFRWTDNTLTVDDILVQDGDVGIETGNITHPGALEIRGDIKDGVTVHARGDIIVFGVVEPSTIMTQGSLIVHGGLVGREDSSVQVGGNVVAKYILGAHVIAGGDVAAVGEIQRSYVRARGRVNIPKGRIAGGVTIAGLGIDVGSVGSYGSSDTALVCKRDRGTARLADGQDAPCIVVRRKMVAGTYVTIGSLSHRTEATIDVPCRVLARDHQIMIVPLRG